MTTAWKGIFMAALLSLPWISHGQTIYVSNTGSDANPGTLAQPKATLQAAANTATTGGTVKVAPGTYAGQLNLAGKSLTIEGAGTIGDPRPVLTLNTGGRDQVLLAFDNCPNTILRGFQLDINQTFLVNGVTTIGNCDNFTLADLRIRAFGSDTLIHSGSPTNPTHGLLLDGSNTTAFPTYTIQNVSTEPTIGSSRGTTWYFDRGILLRGVKGTIGGTVAQACTLKAARDILVQFNGGGPTRIENNLMQGGGVDITLPASTAQIQIVGNRFEPDPRAPGLLAELVLLKQNTNQARLDVETNLFTGFSNVAVRSAGVANAFITGNTFSPNDSALNYRCIEANTLWEGTTQLPVIPNSLTITGNRFNATSGNPRGIAIFLKNERKGIVSPDYTSVQIGGAGADANLFSENLGRFIRLDNQRFRTFVNVLDVSSNNFTISGTAQLPSAMSQADLFRLEDKFDHGIDDDSVGLLRVKPNELFVTPMSHFRPLTSQASIQRAIRFSAPGDIVNIRDSIYPLPITVDKSLTFAPSGTGTVVGNLTMAGSAASDELLLNNTLATQGELQLTQGKIRLRAVDLRVFNPSPTSPSAGSPASYVVTDGLGRLKIANVSGQAVRFPIGTDTAFRPATLTNSGTPDTVALRVRPNVLTQGLTGTPVDTVVDFTWVFTESTPGGGNYTFSPTWRQVDERPEFYRDRTFLQRYNQNRWEFLTGPPPAYLPISGTDPFETTAVGLTQSFASETPLRIYGPRELPDTVYYVDAIDGVDDLTARTGRTPESAWRSLQYALTNSGRVAPSGFIHIRIRSTLSEYNGSAAVPAGKGRMTIRGGYAGTDARPVLTNTLTADPVLTVSADSIFIDKLDIRVTGSQQVGISGQGRYDRLRIDSCLIHHNLPVPSGIGIELQPATVLQNISLTASRLYGDLPLASYFTTAIAAGTVDGIIGGTGSQVNLIAGRTAIDVLNAGNLRIRGNTIQSVGHGVQVVGGTGAVEVVGNTIGEVAEPAAVAVQAIGFIESSSSLRIDSNTVRADTGVHTAAVRQASVRANVLEVRGLGLHVNSGTTAGLPAYVTGNLIAEANLLNTTTSSAKGVLLGNEARGLINPAFNTLQLGSVSGPNTLSANFNRFIEMQSDLGKEFGENLDARNNIYGLPTGPKAPAAMTQAELFDLEDKIVHVIDFAGLGTARVRDNNLYVTPLSFIAPRTSRAALQRTIPPSVDGDVVNIKDANYQDTATVDKSLTFETSGTATFANRIQMRGQDKILDIGKDFTITGGLELTAGKIRIGANNLTLAATCPSPEGGNAGSFVWTSSTGGLRQNQIGPGGKVDSVLFPLGLDAFYNPIYLHNRGTADDYRARLLPDVYSDGVVGQPVPDSVVRASWVLTEGAPGGSEVTLTPYWNQAQEKDEFDRNRVQIQGYFGRWVPDQLVSLQVNGNDPYYATKAFTGRNFSETAVRVLSLAPLPDEVFIPSLFTPNDDGVNDRLLVYSNTIATLTLKIFNRQGNILFETSDVTQALTQGWDGTADGKKCNSDTYVWTVTGSYTNGTSINVQGKNSGFIVLSR